MALAANDDPGVAAAQSPWTVAGGVEAALKVIEDALRARPDMRVTGAHCVPLRAVVDCALCRTTYD
jgi:hypothetical protein